MSGLEQRLTPELETSVTKGLKLKSDLASLKVGDLAGSLISGGSANWPPLGWAVRYRAGDPVARGQWLRFFTESRRKFMGLEMFSLIYWWGHVLPVAAVAEHAGSDPDVAAGANEWLRYYFGVLDQVRDPSSGAILLVGMRSGGHPPEGEATWLGWLRALAKGEDLGRWEGDGRRLKLGMKNSWEYRTAKALQSTLARAAASTEPLPAYGLLTPIHIYQTDEGMAVWCEENVNGNTTPLMGAVSLFGKSLDYLPKNGGAHIRQRFDHATCARNDGRLVYDSNLQGHQELPLPGGAVQREITLGRPDGVAPAPIPAPVEPPPDDGPDLSAVADLIAGLQLSNQQKGMQSRIVAELRNGPQRPLLAIADEVATFGINPEQPQGEPWQEAIRLLQRG